MCGSCAGAGRSGGRPARRRGHLVPIRVAPYVFSVQRRRSVGTPPIGWHAPAKLLRDHGDMPTCGVPDSHPYRTMTFGILVFPVVEELDFVGPWEMLTMWQQEANGPECVLISEHAGPVTCAKGLSVNPHVSFDTCPPLDYLLVPGGMGTRVEVSNARLVEFVATRGQAAKAMLSVCTGAFVLHAAGLLSGKRATTHWRSLDRLRALGDVTVIEERYVQDGNVWTSAGVSAGIDMTLAFIAAVGGMDAAAMVQLDTEYYPSTTRYGSLDGPPPVGPAYARSE